MSVSRAVQAMEEVDLGLPLRQMSQKAQSQMGLATIYLLTDPRTDEIRYVGYTGVALNARLRAHIKLARHRHASGERYPLLNWIVSLVDEGLEPEIVAAETFVEDWQERERFWIAFYRRMGCRLTNTKDGGEGGSRASRSTKRETSPETRAKLSEAAKRRYQDPTQREVTASRLRGIKRSEEFKAKLRKTHCPQGHEYTEENTVVYKGSTGKECRTCRRERGRKRT